VEEGLREIIHWVALIRLVAAEVVAAVEIRAMRAIRGIRETPLLL
jgi:hypothetical protein